MKIRDEYTCHLEVAHDIIKGKWKSIILWQLKDKIQLAIIHIIYSKCRTSAAIVDKNYINCKKETKIEKIVITIIISSTLSIVGCSLRKQINQESDSGSTVEGKQEDNLGSTQIYHIENFPLFIYPLG